MFDFHDYMDKMELSHDYIEVCQPEEASPRAESIIV